MMLQIFLHIILVRFIFWMIIDHPEYESNENDVKKLLKEIDETGEVVRKESSGLPKSVRFDENNKLVE